VRVTFYIGKDGKILFIDTGVSARTHGEDIAAKLAKLGVDER
jgi:peroxiredoxin Q/BCP